MSKPEDFNFKKITDQAGEKIDQEPKLTVKEQLRQLKSAEIVDLKVKGLEGMDVFMIDVKDKELWRGEEELKKLYQPFNQIVFDGFDVKDRGLHYDENKPEIVADAQEYVQFNVNCADKVFVIADKNQMAGFLAISILDKSQEDAKIAQVDLTMVDEKYQNQKYSKELYRLALSQEDIEALVGFTFVPAATKNRLAIGKELGYEGYFCGYKDGRYGDYGPPEEQEKVKKLNQLVLDSLKKDEVLIDGEMPYGYAIWQQEFAMAPLKEEDVKFTQSDPLNDVFRKALLPTQEQYQPDIVYGVLINFKQNK